jgi:hypothetical protein
VTPAGELYFPYMEWRTRTRPHQRPLSQSGLPTADAPAGLFPRPSTIGHPTAEALPALERAIAAHLDVDPAARAAHDRRHGRHAPCAWRWFRARRARRDRPALVTSPSRALPAALGARARSPSGALEQAGA